MKERTEDILTDKKISSFKAIRNLVSYEWIAKNVGFFIYIAFLMVLYIANGHKADKMERDMSHISGEIKELQYEYKTVKSELMSRSREAEIIKEVEPMGLKVSLDPPKRIDYLERNKENKN